MKQILINTEGLQTRIALVKNGKLHEFFIERKDQDRLVGSVYKAQIKNLEPSLQAAFVDIGAEKNAFLHYWDMLPATKEMLEGGGKNKPYSKPQKKNTPIQKNKNQKLSLLQVLKKKLMTFGVEKPEPKPEPAPKRNPRRRRNRKRNRNTYTIEDIPKLFKEDDDVIIQVTKGPIGTKGARVTTNLSIPGRYLVLLPNSNHVGVSKRVDNKEERDRLRQILNKLEIPEGMGVICRTVGCGKEERFFQQDMDMLLDYWQGIEDKSNSTPAPCCIYHEPDLVERTLRDFLTEDVDSVVVDCKDAFEIANKMVKRLSRQERVKIRFYKQSRPLFQKFNLTEQIDNIFKRRVQLPSGGYLCIDETEALIAIDVNSGKNRAGKDHPETILSTNLEAVDEIARQLRLRNVGGLVVLDLIDMRSKKDQSTVFRALKSALMDDRARTKVYPISPLGLIEMTRQREHESLRDTVYDHCPYCSGRGIVKSATSVSVELQRTLQGILGRKRHPDEVRVTVNPHVLNRLRNEDANLLAEMEEEFGGELSFRADDSMHVEAFEITDANTGYSL